MAIINIRVDDKLKNDAEKIFSELGLSMTSAITVFLKASIRHEGIPFRVEIPNKTTKKAFKEADKISSGKSRTKKYSNSTELRKDLKL